MGNMTMGSVPRSAWGMFKPSCRGQRRTFGRTETNGSSRRCKFKRRGTATMSGKRTTHSVGSSNGRRRFGNRRVQLAGHSYGSEVLAASEFGMAEDESRTQSEGDQENEGYRFQTAIGDWFALSGSIDLLGPVLAGVQKPVFEGPVFGEIHPAVVLLLPAAVPELANGSGGEYLRVECGDP